MSSLAGVRREDSTDRPLQTLLDGLDAHAAVVSADGRIELVNAAWWRFALDNGGERGTGPGSDYLKVCEEAGDPIALAVASGIRAVIDRTADSFSCDYPCHSEQVERWFRVRVVPTPGPDRRALVLHHDVTADLKRLREQNREAAFISALTDRVPAEVDAARPLRFRETRLVEVLSGRYALFVQQSWESQVLRTDPPDPRVLDDIAASLAMERASARDVLAMHVAALARFDKDPHSDRVMALTAEARLALVQVMGQLADLYRRRLA